MKFTLSWLKEHLDTTATLEDIVIKLTDIGLEVEDVQDRAAIYSQFKLVEIMEAEKHPNADRLKVCQVKTENGMVQIVCGAPNARAGLKAFHAAESTVIPSNGMVMKKSKIRDVESNGMMVSLAEMSLSDESDGIIEADPSLPIGTTIADALGLGDPIIEINLTPNRPDCAGVRGIARDLAAAGLGTLKPLQNAATIKDGFKSPIDVKIENIEACPIFMGRYIKGVRNGASPDDITKKLTSIGQKPISALVDITNYMSIDLCRPLHVFDADKIKGNIHVRLAKKGEEFLALNGKTYQLDDFMTVVCDDSGVIGLAGVMGGESTSVSETTTNVYLEVAYFDPYRTAKTGRALGINSDARYRFERGIDPQFTIEAVDIATTMIISLCGGEASEAVQAGEVPDWKREITWHKETAAKILGFDIPLDTQAKILTDLGFVISGDKVAPPSWRPDIEGEVDLVEEIARIYGFDKIPSISVTRDGAVAKSAETNLGSRMRKSRNILAANGLQECVTWSFMPSNLAAKFGANDAQSKALKLQNPISADLDQMRPSALPNLIEAAKRNTNRGFADVALFEVGPIFKGTNVEDQQIVATGIRAGANSSRHWNEALRNVDAYDAKADALRVIEVCGVQSGNVQITRDVPNYYHPGRSGALKLGPTVLAYFGEIHPALLQEMDIKSSVAGFEAFIEYLPEPKKKSGTALPPLKLSDFQPVNRDFAFLADKSVDADAFVKTIKLVDRELISDVSVFDIYTGKGVEDGKKSVAVAVTLQPKDRTLTDSDIEGLSKKIVDAVMSKTGASLRG